MKILIILIITLQSFNLFGTRQRPDCLIYNGKRYDLNVSPLEKYFESNIEKRPKVEQNSTGLRWRYVATFEIKNKMLVLKDIKVRKGTLAKVSIVTPFSKYDTDYFQDNSLDGNWKSVKKEFFEKDKTKDEDEYYKEEYKPVKLNWYQKFIAETTQKDFVVDWFTGVLVLPYGKILNYVHMGYGSTYENYILLEIDEGKLIKEMKLNAKEYQLFREVQFSEFKKTKKYKEISKSLVDKNNNKEFIEGFLRDFVISYTSQPLD